jgi:peptide-methionine (S)-S-oxide reductase
MPTNRKVDIPVMNDTAPPLLPPHFVSGRPVYAPWPDGYEEASFAMGCFWGAERLFWQATGVWVTMVGYSGGHDEAPSYVTVCAGKTGHAEAVRVIFDPKEISYAQLLQLFWENHDPTQGLRQGNDVGSQYRSMIFTTSPEQEKAAKQSAAHFQDQLSAKGLGQITTKIVPAGPFYYAEDDHQQYLAKNPQGYCGLKGTGAQCAI